MDRSSHPALFPVTAAQLSTMQRQDVDAGHNLNVLPDIQFAPAHKCIHIFIGISRVVTRAQAPPVAADRGD